MGVGDESVPGLAQRRMHKEEATRTNFILGGSNKRKILSNPERPGLPNTKLSP
jgi:hypothetical protein